MAPYKTAVAQRKLLQRQLLTLLTPLHEPHACQPAPGLRPACSRHLAGSDGPALSQNPSFQNPSFGFEGFFLARKPLIQIFCSLLGASAVFSESGAGQNPDWLGAPSRIQNRNITFPSLSTPSQHPQSELRICPIDPDSRTKIRNVLGEWGKSFNCQGKIATSNFQRFRGDQPRIVCTTPTDPYRKSNPCKSQDSPSGFFHYWGKIRVSGGAKSSWIVGLTIMVTLCVLSIQFNSIQLKKPHPYHQH